MPQLESPSFAKERCEKLECHILDRTGHRVHGLRVEVRDEQVILRGHTSSYYVKQLAQHCVWDVLPGAPLQNDIVVE
jgi:hypothetical protein